METFLSLYEISRVHPNSSRNIQKLIIQGNFNHSRTYVAGITQLASIAGPIFDTSSSIHSAYTGKLLNIVTKLMQNIRGSIDMNGAAQVLLRLTSNHKLSSMITVPEITGIFLGDLAEFSIQVMKFVQHVVSAADFQREEAEETMDFVLQCWVNLLSGTLARRR